MNDYILKAEHVQKDYNGKNILNNVSINIKRGDIYGLIGKMVLEKQHYFVF